MPTAFCRRHLRTRADSLVQKDERLVVLRSVSSGLDLAHCTPAFLSLFPKKMNANDSNVSGISGQRRVLCIVLERLEGGGRREYHHKLTIMVFFLHPDGKSMILRAGTNQHPPNLGRAICCTLAVYSAGARRV